MKCNISRAHILIYRAAEGAVKNTADGHPHWPLNATIAQSIAKRVTGTLTAQWRDVLAAHIVPSDSASGTRSPVRWPPPHRYAVTKAGGGRRVVARRPPLNRIWKEISKMIGEAKRQAQPERAEALIDVCRLISKYQ